MMNEEEIILVLDYENVCRLCLKSSGTLSNILSVNEDETPLENQITELTAITVNAGDALPKNICHRCRYQVEIAFQIRNLAWKSDKLLNIALANNVVSSNHQNIEMLEDLDKETRSRILQENASSLSINYEENQIDNNDLDIKNNDVTPNQEFSIESEELNGRHYIPKLDTKKQEQPRRVIPLKQRVCQICLCSFKNKYDVKRHALEQHYKGSRLRPYFIIEKPFTCDICQELVQSKNILITHHRLHLKVNPYKCDICGSGFRTKQSLSHHSLVHGERRHVCDSCGASFRRIFELNQHALRHEDESHCYPCGVCRVVCSNRISYKAHMRHHELGRRFPCPRSGCPKAYFSQTDLKVHLRSHDNDRCFQCPLCVSSYISQSQLNRHLRQHNKNRLNKCDKCSSTFADYAEYCNHRISVHGHWHPFKCIGCNQGYQNERHLKNHMEKCMIAQDILANAQKQDEEALVKELENVNNAVENDEEITVRHLVHADIDAANEASFIIQANEDGTILPTGLIYLKPPGSSDENVGTWYTIVDDPNQEQT